MVDIQGILNNLITQLKDILPAQIKDYWYLVVIVGFLIILLILVNLGKLLFRKKSPEVEAFKQQNLQQGPPGRAPPRRRPMPRQPMPPARQQPQKDYKQLDQFIKSQLDASFDVQMVRDNLVSVGWDARTVSNAINRVVEDMKSAAKGDDEKEEN